MFKLLWPSQHKSKELRSDGRYSERNILSLSLMAIARFLGLNRNFELVKEDRRHTNSLHKIKLTSFICKLILQFVLTTLFI